MNSNTDKVLDISRKTFISVMIILIAVLFVSILLTYLIPAGIFPEDIDPVSGERIVHYDSYQPLPDSNGIPILKGILAPVLVLGSGDGLALIMLSLFLSVVTGSFQVMSDCHGMQLIVELAAARFGQHRKILVAVIILLFMLFGSVFGLFEEILTLLPFILMLSLSLGYDSYTGFLISIVATGFGFASALTNPFTVVTASVIIGASIVKNLWFRILLFLTMYLLLLLFVFRHLKRIAGNPSLSPTYEGDLGKKEHLSLKISAEDKDKARITRTYLCFLLIVFLTIVIVTSIEAVRGLTVVFLIAVFLIGGLLSGLIASRDPKLVFRGFFRGIVSALPGIAMVLVASSIKYIMEEGQILPTIANSISTVLTGKPSFLVALLLFAIVLVIEFFISSSTAKAIFVMGILSVCNLALSKEFLVLVYMFGDGYTNVLFPTSPVLLIALSMAGISYPVWIKKSRGLFGVTLALTVLFLGAALLIRY